MNGRARSWVGHLRDGGTTPWSAWEAAPRDDEARPPFRPGAQQLELLRRVNLARAGRTPDHALADRVLAASAFDRGRADLPLVGLPHPGHGPAPVDPAGLAPDELLRVATLLLADALPGLPGWSGAASVPADGLAARLRRAAGGYRLAGDPWVAGVVREELRRRGRPPGGRRPVVLLAARPLPRLLADTWAHQVLSTGAAPWPTWLDGVTGRRLPPGADLAGQAARWSGRVGRQRVVVATDLAGLGRRAGVRVLDTVAAGAVDPGATTIELARRVRQALVVVAPPDDHERLLRERLVPLLDAVPGSAAEGSVVVPERHARWVRRRAARQHRRLTSAGYAVAGDVDLLLRGGSDAAGGEADAMAAEAVLDLAVAALAGGALLGVTDGGGS